MIAKTASVLSLLALLLVGCGVREDYEPYDCTPEFERFLARFDAEYRGAYLVNRLRSRLLDSSPGLPEARGQGYVLPAGAFLIARPSLTNPE